MFIEPNIRGDRRGWIEVICGSMFSGKTEELIRRLKRVKIANQKVEIFKPTIDVRYDVTKIVSHDTTAIQSTPVDNSQKILLMAQGVDVIGVDEAQFFDVELPNVCDELASRGIRVIVAGLDMDYLGMPFGPIPNLLAGAEYVTKVHAICMKCGGLANHSYRKTQNDSRIMLGELESYAALCRNCFNEELK